MKNFIAVIVATAFFICTNAGIAKSQNLTGRWVDVNTQTDTLIFGVIGRQDMMMLNRAKEARNGVMRPKAGFGPYRYKLLSDKISLQWSLSSDSAFYDFYFRQNGDNEIVVENFYDTNARGTTVTFRKLI